MGELAESSKHMRGFFYLEFLRVATIENAFTQEMCGCIQGKSEYNVGGGAYDGKNG